MEKHFVSEPAAAIERITDDRCIQAQAMGGMQPELVRSPGQRRKLNSHSKGFVGQFSPEGYAPFPVYRVIHLVGPSLRIQAKQSSIVPESVATVPSTRAI